MRLYYHDLEQTDLSFLASDLHRVSCHVCLTYLACKTLSVSAPDIIGFKLGLRSCKFVSNKRGTGQTGISILYISLQSASPRWNFPIVSGQKIQEYCSKLPEITRIWYLRSRKLWKKYSCNYSRSFLEQSLKRLKEITGFYYKKISESWGLGAYCRNIAGKCGIFWDSKISWLVHFELFVLANKNVPKDHETHSDFSWDFKLDLAPLQLGEEQGKQPV